MSKIKKDYTLVTCDITLSKAVAHIEEVDYLTFDVESTGLNVRKDKVIGFGFCGKAGVAFYIPILKWIVKDQVLEKFKVDYRMILDLLCKKDLIMHNGSYDVRITKNNLNVDLLENLVLDTMLMWHSINEEGPFGLKKICSSLEEEIGYDVEDTALKEKEEMDASITANGGSVTKSNYELYKADWDKIGKYCCADVDMTFRLFDYAYDKLEKEGLLEFVIDEEVMPLYRSVTIPMEDKGVKIDMDYMKSNYEKLQKKIQENKHKVIEELLREDNFNKWLDDKSKEKIKISSKGKFAQKLASIRNLNLPLSPKTGKYSLTMSNIKNLENSPEKEFLMTGKDLDPVLEKRIRLSIWYDQFDGFPLNLSSKQQLSSIVFDYFGYVPSSKTKKGRPQFNDTFVDYLAEEGESWAFFLKVYNKLMKLKNSYYDRYMELNEDGYYYFSYKQHGTISGRYGSDAQQLPRPMEDGQDHEDVVYFNNTIRRFFVAEEGRVFIDSDFESLEPHVFSHVSGDEGLRNIFRKGHDFYSTIAIATEGLKGVSADKKAENYLGKVNKQLRQSAKAYSLGIPYGLSSYALSKTLEIEQEEAEKLVNGYLSGFPELKKWMDSSKYQAQTKGYVSSEVGRIRHLPKVKTLYKKHGNKLMDFRYRNKLISSMTKKGMDKEEAREEVTKSYLDYKNGINNARNFQIQSLSGSIVNRAAIKIQQIFKEKDIDAWVCAQVHDQLIFNVPESCKKQCIDIIQDTMENNYKLSVDLKAPPEESKNWRDGH